MKKSLRIPKYSVLATIGLLCYAGNAHGANTSSEADKFSNRMANIFRPMILQDDDVARELTKTGRAIVAANNLKSRDKSYSFQVVVDPLPNSFSTSTGDVYLTTGLLGILSSKSELAAVISREIALVEMGAFDKGVASEKTANFLVAGAAVSIVAISAYLTVSATLENLDSDSKGAVPSQVGTLLLSALSVLPFELQHRSRAKRLDEARVPEYLLTGREANGTTFDAQMLKMIYEGYPADVELEADKKSIELMKHTPYDSLALATVLEKLHTHGGNKASHVKSAAPGLAVRLENLGAGRPAQQKPAKKKSEIWDDMEQ